MVLFDFFNPILYKIEKTVAGMSIPAVHHLSNRKTMDDLEAIQGKTFDHSLWDALLKEYVNVSGTTIHNVTGIHTVDYEGLAQDDRFAKYLTALQNAQDPAESLSGPEQVAFWMNAYNALCVSLLVQHKPKKSINDLSTKERPVWDMDAGSVASTKVSLNHIEHVQLRSKFAIPEVHGCIVCASASCPNLRNQAYTGDKLQAQMQDQMTSWLQNETKGAKLSSNGGTLELSRIFLWFQDDFAVSGGVVKFLQPYIKDAQTKEALFAWSTRIRYFAYDWTINKKKP